MKPPEPMVEEPETHRTVAPVEEEKEVVAVAAYLKCFYVKDKLC
jgi:hypothetical protein